ncbi:hypothetical protein C8R43DRAFT_864925, partial [Mycena crocata]
MPSAPYKSFAVAGGGQLGLPIVGALAAQNVSVVLLSRPNSASKTVPVGVAVAEVDFTDVAAVAAVLQKHKVDVVLSTISMAAAAAQKSLIDGAKLADVKLFVPAEYAIPTDGATEGPFGDKQKIAEYLQGVGMPSVRVFTGLFLEAVPLLLSLTEGKVKIVGKGDAPVSFTAIPDIAGFVAHVLTTLPPTELEDRIFRLQGDRASLNGVAAQFNAAIEYVTVIEGEMGEVLTGLQTLLDIGMGSTGWDTVSMADGTGARAAGSANVLWPGHHWKTLKEV